MTERQIARFDQHVGPGVSEEDVNTILLVHP